MPHHSHQTHPGETHVRLTVQSIGIISNHRKLRVSFAQLHAASFASQPELQ